MHPNDTTLQQPPRMTVLGLAGGGSESGTAEARESVVRREDGTRLGSGES